MRATCCMLPLAVVLLGLAGCQDQGQSQPDVPAITEETLALDPAAAEASTPAEAVTDFLQAVKQGDDDTAARMLTQVAQHKTAELDMAVSPPGSDTARFEIGQVVMDDEDHARVASAWTDIDREGNPRTDQITWLLRRQEEGWRISGMATKIFADNEPVVLNFEDPQDMLNKQEDAEQEAARRADANQLEARRPEDPFQSGPQ